MMPRQRALEVLCLDDPGAKAAAARALFATLSDDAIDAYIELKMQDVTTLRMSTHPVEYEMYYSV